MLTLVARCWPVWLLAFTLVLSTRPGTALAHGTGPARTVPVTAGSYRLEVLLYDEPVRAGREFSFSVDPVPGSLAPGERLQLVATATPAARVNAVPVRAGVGPHLDGPGGVAGQIYLPVAGSWTLRLDMQGPLGTAVAEVPLLAAPPPAIPIWLGWLIGLVPVWGLLGFVLTQAWSAWRAGGLVLEEVQHAT